MLLYAMVGVGRDVGFGVGLSGASGGVMYVGGCGEYQSTTNQHQH